MPDRAKPSFRILSIDGGGVKGAFAAAALEVFEKRLGSAPIASKFDLICGTSTGGIIALALASGRRPGEVRSLYELLGPVVFREAGVFGAAWAGLRQVFWGPGFDSSLLMEQLRGFFAERTMRHCTTSRVLVTAYDVNAGRDHYFRHYPGVHTADAERTLAEVALATSAAPTFFGSTILEGGERMVDGGVFANCPGLCGAIEAHAELGVPFKDIAVMSIGATTAPFSVSKRAASGGLMQWNLRLIELLMEAQVSSSQRHLTALLGPNFLRINASVAPGRFRLDRATDISDLVGLGNHTAGERFREVQEFLST